MTSDLRRSKENRRNTESELFDQVAGHRIWMVNAVNSNLNNDAVNGGSNTLEGENVKANEAIPVLGNFFFK